MRKGVIKGQQEYLHRLDARRICCTTRVWVVETVKSQLNIEVSRTSAFAGVRIRWGSHSLEEELVGLLGWVFTRFNMK